MTKRRPWHLSWLLVGSALMSLATFVPTFADETRKAEIDRIISAGREDNKVMEHLDILSNRIGPRLTSSDALQYACEWTRDRFKEIGLENARLEEWGEFAVGFNRGPWCGKMVEPEEKTLQFGTWSWTPGTKGVTRGPALLAPTSPEELDKVRPKLPGAWIASASTGPGGPSISADFRKTLDAAYKEAGIAGLVRPTRGELIVTSGNYRISWETLPTTVTIDLVKKQHDEIVALLKEDKPVTLEFDIRNYFKKGPIKLYNVIADIPGTEFPDEYVIVGGHIDTWDGATGTVDNGTGVSTTLEAARILMKAGAKPRRTIRFMLWSGEEQGLLGSQAYVKAHPELMPKISGVFVHDGGTNYLSGIGATKAMRKDFDEVFASILELDSAMPFKIRDVEGLRGGGSDHASFLSAGVPGFFWGQSGKANYTRAHHTQYDTYDAAIPEYQRHSSIIAAIGAFGVANLDHLLSREKLRAPGGAGGGNRRTMGVQLDELKIVEILPGSMAEKVGLKLGDTFVSVDGTKLNEQFDLIRTLQQGEPKKKVLIGRDGKEIEVILDWSTPVQPKAQP